ncbi:acyl-CoA dehydrogenase [Nocardia abscessus]|uniref:acyl-CoA dehydrogenase family protein n=1 Tax=Nocardia TaxID=1817 RepID=UPI001894D7E5|nr:MULTISPECIES: acyl-CoA dehydrogenase family protein [Nocardia]MBF6222133.1 acyl-CoA dehydrogenase [Nocardia abscessus]MDE1672513.1 acyl-CoA dehydrogenase family protein [Nocardia gipuzkoensis]
MDVRLTSEQRQLRDAAAKLADDLGPGSVAELDDENRRARLERAVTATGWRALRTDGASGVEVAIVTEEFGRGLVDVAFLGPVLADDLCGRLGAEGRWTIAAGGRAIDARGSESALLVTGEQVVAAPVGATLSGADLTRQTAAVADERRRIGELSPDEAIRWHALAVTATTADLLGVARGAQDLAVGYAKVREQYGRPIGSYQAVAHLLAENHALIEGAISVLRHAAWAVDELAAAQALRAARIAKVYTARAARTVCETSIQVHGGIGNTWECLAHVYLRRALVSTELFPVRLEEIDLGLS